MQCNEMAEMAETLLRTTTQCSADHAVVNPLLTRVALGHRYGGLLFYQLYTHSEGDEGNSGAKFDEEKAVNNGGGRANGIAGADKCATDALCCAVRDCTLPD